MEEQRQRYGPPLYRLTTMVLLIRVFISLSWGRFETRKLWEFLQSFYLWLFCSKCISIYLLTDAFFGFLFFPQICIDTYLLYELSRTKEEVAILEQAADVYTTEFERFITFIRYYSYFCLQLGNFKSYVILMITIFITFIIITTIILVWRFNLLTPSFC